MVERASIAVEYDSSVLKFCSKISPVTCAVVTRNTTPLEPYMVSPLQHLPSYLVLIKPALREHKDRPRRGRQTSICCCACQSTQADTHHHRSPMLTCLSLLCTSAEDTLIVVVDSMPACGGFVTAGEGLRRPIWSAYASEAGKGVHLPESRLSLSVIGMSSPEPADAGQAGFENRTAAQLRRLVRPECLVECERLP